jgi:hypothetical protein
MAPNGKNIEPRPRRGHPNLSHPDRVAMMRQLEDIWRLPETDCPASASDWARRPNQPSPSPGRARRRFA